MIQRQKAVSTAQRRQTPRQNALVRQYTLALYISMLCFFTYALTENTGVSLTIPHRALLALVGGGFCTCFLLMNRRDVRKRLSKSAFSYVLMAFAGFCALTAVSALVTKSPLLPVNTVTYTLLLQLYLLEGICLVVYATVTGKTKEVFDCCFYCMLVFVLANDALMFSGLRRFSDGQFETYLLGTKFDVVYMHMNLMALFFTRMKLRRPGKKNARLPVVMLLAFLLLNVTISLRLDCSTGLIGSVATVLLIYFFDGREKLCRKILCAPKAFITVCTVSMLFASYVFWLVKQPIVRHIVVDWLGKSLTLTGRTEIYAMYPHVMSGHWIWGFGLGNAYAVCSRAFGYADVQNALLQWVLEVGVPSAVMLVVFFCTIIALCKRTRRVAVVIPVLALEYVYLLLGAVEITMNRCFIMLMIVLMLLAGSDQLPNKRLGVAGSELETRRGGAAGEEDEN